MTIARLSQGHLNLLDTCPRKFQHIYLDQLASPLDPEQQERLAWGSQFHLLMQQREMGLPLESILAENDRYANAIASLVRAVPEIAAPSPDSQREAEHYRSFAFEDYTLSVIYDLLVTHPNSAHILDWKTYRKPLDSHKIQANWQTRLYLFVLVETSNYTPEQLSMTYWFVQGSPECATIPYSRQKHERTRSQLQSLLNQLNANLERYYSAGIPFPQVPETKGECEYCTFNRRCQRSRTDNPSLALDWQTLIEEIEEVAL
ncbi:PD-(D/E)XK nuclease family protein [Oscillatoria sp. FACHB-1406]|uniref:PD-(D/E)XK nuclease family protein n=1 Tax=Oscillatoria sp. FACHB-1406 TaxID=2692846 RepID=UPI001688CA0A|nr:PD-(D/E)XK nuclease family protein [Oscillatoria sp. FACHB-1406]MBD2579777.1 PD-(D/E)XK nuclease family protein [Oscillatoria sp. FACHB-1406]